MSPVWLILSLLLHLIRQFFFLLHPTPLPQITSINSNPPKKEGEFLPSLILLPPSPSDFKIADFLALFSILLNKKLLIFHTEKHFG